MKKTKTIIGICATCLVLASCNGYEKILNGNNYEAKYEAAMKYYNNNNYSKAIQLFENLTLHYRGKENAEEIAWYYAQSLFKEKDYFTAAYQFKRFTRQFPYSQQLEEAAYMAAYCKYLDSPDYALDQKMTREAIEDFESFAERWPRSTRMPEVNRCLDELRAKLMKKNFEIAYGYYFTEEYQAAYESFRRFLNLYPESEDREEAMFYQLDAGFRFAINSREDKQRERLQLVVNDFEKFSSSFAQSKHLAAAQNIYTKARAALTAIEQGTTIEK
ncbi:MAG: outer membrane protein assembly factor BamD [Bacteroidales bacterium]|nr:outer membrane protein assembly factor BamD [Bacteroidales bacterium]